MENRPREHYNLYYIFLEDKQQRRLSEEIAARMWEVVRAAMKLPSS